MLQISIVINNFNYEKYLRSCIDSALSQDYGNFEVIVVDDGSTDNSKKIIEEYSERITYLLKENGGQGSSYNSGYELAKGDWVVFLDADDMLSSDALKKYEMVITPDASKVHGYLEILEPQGKTHGARTPTTLHDGDVRPIIEVFGCYGSPPGSGNAYSRKFLTQVMPLPSDKWRIAADAYLIHLAPFYGKIRNVQSKVGIYRIHNQTNNRVEFSLNNSPSHPSESLERGIVSSKEMLIESQKRGFLLKGYTIGSTPSEMKIRLISRKFYPESHPISGDSFIKIIIDSLRVICVWPQATTIFKTLFWLWVVVVAIFPKSLAQYPAKIVINRKINYGNK